MLFECQGKTDGNKVKSSLKYVSVCSVCGGKKKVENTPFASYIKS